MGQDWPSPHHHEHRPLPRVEDLPPAWEGYDRERVQAAFDAFYRHIAQLDATLRALESVEAFRVQAGDLRVELRALRAAGWAPSPRGYTLTPERSMLGTVPGAVGRIALEVIFLVIVAAVVAVARFSSLEIVGVMAGAVLITFLVELIAARDRREATPIPAAEPVSRSVPAPPAQAVAVVEQTPAAEEAASSAAEDDQPTTGELSIALVQLEEPEPEVADDGVGWAAFAEPAGPPLSVMGALAAEDEEAGVEEDEPAAEEPEQTGDAQPAEAEPDELPVLERAVEPIPEPEPEPAEAVQPEPDLTPEPEPEQVREPEPPAESAPAVPLEAVQPEPERDVEPVADSAEEATGTIARRGRFRRRRHERRPVEPAPAAAPAPKHVRVLPAPDAGAGDSELPPWERGFDETDERRR